MKKIPIAAIVIAIKVVVEIFSFKKMYAKKAATKGIAPSIIIVTAAVVVVIDKEGIVRHRWVAENPGVEPDYDEIVSFAQSLS